MGLIHPLPFTVTLLPVRLKTEKSFLFGHASEVCLLFCVEASPVACIAVLCYRTGWLVLIFRSTKAACAGLGVWGREKREGKAQINHCHMSAVFVNILTGQKFSHHKGEQRPTLCFMT